MNAAGIRRQLWLKISWSAVNAFAAQGPGTMTAMEIYMIDNLIILAYLLIVT